MKEIEKFPVSIDLHDDVIQKLEEIEAELRACDINVPGLCFGKIGFALFYDAMYQLTGDEKYMQECYSIVDQVIEMLESAELSHNYAAGYTGIAWVISYLLKRGNFQTDASDLFSEIDPHIFRSAHFNLDANFLECFHGAGGAVLYGLDRLDQPGSAEFLSKFIEAADTSKVVTLKGYKWRDDFSRLPGPADAVKSTMGLAHGVTGIISLLVKIHKHTGFKKETENLITGGIDWLLAHSSKDPSTFSVYPTYTIGDEPSGFSSRLGWCQGDLSVAITMMNAGRALGNHDWEQHSISIMEKATRRMEVLRNGLEDAGLCHGTAGVAQVFNRFAEWTGREDFKNSAKYWIWQTLQKARYNDGLAGYKAMRALGNPLTNSEINDHGFLEGIAGIGLGLISYLDNRSNWDESLLITV